VTSDLGILVAVLNCGARERGRSFIRDQNNAAVLLIDLRTESSALSRRTDMHARLGLGKSTSSHLGHEISAA
jgi:hypothetical protein